MQGKAAVLEERDIRLDFRDSRSTSFSKVRHYNSRGLAREIASGLKQMLAYRRACGSVVGGGQEQVTVSALRDARPLLDKTALSADTSMLRCNQHRICGAVY